MSRSTSELVGIKKHEVYYIEGGDVYFLVGEYLFRVHRHFFEGESSKFRRMFGGLTSPGKEPKGSSPGTAFRLSDITAEDFAHFLWIFYTSKPSVHDASTDVWVTILRTACKWLFPKIKALAIIELERRTITLVDPIVLHQDYKVDPSLSALLYAKLCSRDEPLTMKESVGLGIETTVRIFQTRERLRSSLDGLKNPLPNGVDLADVMQVMDEVWGGDTKCASGLSTNTQQRRNGAPTKHRSRSTATPAQSMPEPFASLKRSANRWDRRLFSSSNPNSPNVVDRKVRALLNKLTMEKFDSLSDQIITWANKSEKEKDGRTLIQVIRLVFEKATDEAMRSEMYARLCRKMMEQISPKVQDDGIKNAEGKPIAGGQLFRKYLLNRCQEDFERGWATKEAIAAAAASKAIEGQAAKAAAEKKGDGEQEIVLYSEEYYAAQKARRQGLGLIKFMGELFKVQMLTERIMHECVKKLLVNSEEEDIESLCILLTTTGQFMDTTKAQAHMDLYFSRMKELTKSLNVSSRMQFMLQDILELRERKWVSRNAVAVPTTIAQIHEAAAKERAAQEEAQERQKSKSRRGSRRGGERLKSGQNSNKGAPSTSGPQSSIHAGKKDKRESVQRTNSSSQNMVSVPNANSTSEATPKEMFRRKLFFPDEGSTEPKPVKMASKNAKKKIEKKIKDFIAARNLDEAEIYFTQLPAKHHPLLVDKLVSFAIKSEADAQLVAELFSRASTKNLCKIADFETGFAGVIEALDDIAIAAPMAFKLMAIMMRGPAFDAEQRTRLASKTSSTKLLELLS
ncbi:ARM repeat-containing protein [Armillaria solidipes]|uniref:ARM repeat-containing protein n=1 Tax=Armillaria solidipes TaxID=1076256 RepID=A0A2H3BT33_9AGAR|nr:ARM repeat-containing protein [Armillaria solidipes]